MAEWQKDGDPCNDCGQPARYVEETGWYEHIDPNAAPCFLMDGPHARTREDNYLRRPDGSIYGAR